MAVSIRWVVVLGLMLVTSLSLAAPEPADESAAPEAEPSAAEAAPGPASPPFDQLLAEWKTLLGELRDLRVEYASADEGNKAELKTRFNEKIDQGNAMVPQLIQAAQEAYSKTPGGDKAAGDFLMGTVVHWSKAEEYEAVLPVAKTLIDGEYPNTSIYAFAGLAAFAAGRFDTAGEYLKKADEGNAFGALDALAPGHQFRDIGGMYGELIPYYRKAWAEEEKIRAAEAEADDLPRVLLSTNKGDIEIELFENEAPNTVANFISLIEKGYYDGITFHRVLPGFMAQGGCPDGTGMGGPGYTIKCECTKPNHRLHFRGSLSMAKAAAPDTGGSQFFLVFAPLRHLDGKHTVFGRIVKGIEVLARIQRRNPQAANPPTPDKIVEAKVIRKRDHEYVPETIPE